MSSISATTLATAFPSSFRGFQLLGSGGFGAVYRTYDLVRRYDVALKISQLSMGEDEVQHRARFVREFNLLKGIRHPRFVEVLSQGVVELGLSSGGTAQHVWYSMELCGGALNTKRLLQMNVKERASAALMLAEGIAFLHEKEIAHRDIKPLNIFYSGTEIKIGDFGIAKHMKAPDLTKPGMILGSFDYLAPERWGGTGDDWRPSDVYACGLTAYAILSRGSHAIAGPADVGMQSALGWLAAHQDGRRNHVEIPELPTMRFRQIDELLGRMVDPHPTNRSKMAAVARELRTCLIHYRLL